MALVAGWASSRRSDAIQTAVTEALRQHATVLNGTVGLRGVTVMVKMRNGSTSVRTVVVTVETEMSEETADADRG